jgi:hypothetical protein
VIVNFAFNSNIVALMVEAVQTFVNSYQSARRYSPEGSHLSMKLLEGLRKMNVIQKAVFGAEI